MKSGPSSHGKAPSAHSTAEVIPEGKVAADYAANLREALAEANSTIQLLQQALVLDEDAAKREHPPYKEFFCACESGDVTAITDLLTYVELNYRASPGVTGLHIAASNGHLEVVRLLLDNGAELDPRLGLLNCSFGYQIAGATPLILAATNQRTEVVQLLIERGALRGATTDKGFTERGLIQLLQSRGQSSINLHIT